MTKRRRKGWRYAAGRKGARVTVFERQPGGNICARAWDPSARGGRGWYRVRSLGYAVRDADGELIEERVSAAEDYALAQAAKLREGPDDIRAGRSSPTRTRAGPSAAGP